jgi:hypothetical protein
MPAGGVRQTTHRKVVVDLAILFGVIGAKGDLFLSIHRDVPY